MTDIDEVKAARDAAAKATRALRYACVEAAKSNPIRQVAIAADVTRQTIYTWIEASRSDKDESERDMTDTSPETSI